jgi:hypothetical protein
MVEQGGIEAWFRAKSEDFGVDAKRYRKLGDTLDVWFDSGSTHETVIGGPRGRESGAGQVRLEKPAGAEPARLVAGDDPGGCLALVGEEDGVRRVGSGDDSGHGSWRRHQERKLRMLQFWRDGVERQLAAVNASISTLERQMERDAGTAGG